MCLKPTDSSTPSTLPELSFPVSSPSDLGAVVEVTMVSAPLRPPSGTRIDEEEPSLGIIESSIEEPLMGDDTVSENPTPNNHVYIPASRSKTSGQLGIRLQRQVQVHLTDLQVSLANVEFSNPKFSNS